MNKMILIGAGALVLGAAGGGAFFFMKSPEPVEGEMMEEEMAEEMMPNIKDAIYEDIHPAFTVNFIEGSTKKFLSVYMVAMFYDMESRDSFTMHLPAVRNRLLMLLGGRDSDDLNTTEQKENLRKEALMAVQEVMQERYGENLVQEIFFTKLVMQ